MLDLFPRVQPGPPRPSRILNPRDLQRKSGMERYEIPGGGALMVEIDAGDALILRNAEGGQVAEMLAADASGAIDSGVIGVKADSTGEGLKALIAAGGPGMARLRAGLTRRGIDLSRARVAQRLLVGVMELRDGRDGGSVQRVTQEVHEHVGVVLERGALLLDRDAEHGSLEIIDRTACALQKNTSQAGQLNIPRRAVEQPDTNEGLELFNTPTDGGRRNVDGLCRSTETALVRYRNEGL